jgi:hypothetical protein
MGKCIFCGQAAGFFRSEHKECRQADDAAKYALIQQRNREQQDREILRLRLLEDATNTIRSGGDLVALEGRLLQEVADQRINHPDIKLIVGEAWKVAADGFLDDGLLNEEEEARLASSRHRFDLVDSMIDSSGALDRVKKAAVLRRVMTGDAGSNMTVEDGFPVVLQRGEKAVWCFNGVDYLEDRTRRQFVGGSQGVSVRIMKGVYYRVGAFKGESVYSTERQHVGNGLLLVTDTNLYFHGAAKSFRIPFKKIVSFTPFADGIGLVRDAQTAKPQIFVTKDGWFTYNLITNMAKFAA